MIKTIRLLVCMMALMAIAAPAMAEPEIGRPAPALSGQELNDAPFDLSTMKGKVVLVHFWATWCPDCLAEMGVLNDFYRRYHDRGVEIIAISTDKPRVKDQVEAMMKPLGFPAALLSDTGTNGFGRPNAIPVTYVIDATGTLRARLSPDRRELTPKLLADSVEPLLNPVKNGQ